MPRTQNGQTQVMLGNVNSFGKLDGSLEDEVAENENNQNPAKRLRSDGQVNSIGNLGQILSIEFSTSAGDDSIRVVKSVEQVDGPSDETSDIRIPRRGRPRLAKRGRPRKAYVFPVVLTSATTSTQSNNDNSTINMSNVDGGDVNGGLNSAKVRHDNERTCHVCGKYYWKPSDLQRHLYKHTGERRFSCPICDQFFSCKRNMQYHQKAVHGLAIELSPGLDKKWKRRSYYFRAIEALKAAGGVQPTMNGTEMNGELDGEHSVSEVINSEPEEPTVENQSPNVKGSGVDSSVTETEDDSSACEVFVSVEDGDNTDVEFKIDTMSEEVLISRSKGVNTSSGESTFVYKCHMCDKMFVSIDTLHTHFVEHLESLKPDNTNVCELCGELFGTKYDLSVHLEDHPAVDDDLRYEPETILSEEDQSATGEVSDGHDDMPSLLSPETLSDMAHASLALPVLEEVGSSSSAIELNDESWRPGGFKCKVCSKTFDRSFSLNRHLRSHTGVKKCYCTHCGRGFCEQRNLRHHIIRFHSDGSERHLLRRTRNRSNRKYVKEEEEDAERLSVEAQQPALQNHQPLQLFQTVAFIPVQPPALPVALPTPTSKDSEVILTVDTSKIKKEQDGDVTESSSAATNDVVDSVRKLLLLKNNIEIKEEKEDPYENGLSSCLLESEKEDIVIKVEPPSYSEEEEMEQESKPLPPPQLPSAEPLLVITGSPKLFTRKGRGRPIKRKSDEEENSNSLVVNEVPSSVDAVDDGTAIIKKGSHISKYTPRLPIIDKPERVKVIHPRRMADGMIVFPCCYCDKVFTSTSDVHRHMNFHEDIRPYKCNQCHYYSRTTSQLKVHMMRHKGIKKYFCEPCNYYGVTQSDVNRHKKSQAHFARLAESNEVSRSNSNNEAQILY